MLSARPQGLFTWNYDLLEDGAGVGDLTIKQMSERGEVRLADETFRVYRDGFLGPFVLAADDGRIVARAEKVSALSRTFVLPFEAGRLELKAMSVFSRAMGLFLNGAQIGLIAPAGLFTRKLNVNLPPALPLELRAFLVWLTVLLMRRASRSSSS